MSKGPEAFRTISEASQELGVPPHVLRFWETRFSFVRPMKRAGGRRFYRRQDLELLRGLRVLLHEEGYTIKGVQRLHRERGVARVTAAGSAPPPAVPADDAEAAMVTPTPTEDGAGAPMRPVLGAEARQRLEGVLDDLEGARAAIDRLLAAAS